MTDTADLEARVKALELVVVALLKDHPRRSELDELMEKLFPSGEPPSQPVVKAHLARPRQLLGSC